MLHILGGIHEVLGVGTLFVDESGHPRLHMHAAAGREGKAVVGCTRAGVEVWLVGEVVLLEISGIGGCVRKTRKPVFRCSGSQIRKQNDNGKRYWR